MCGRDRGFDSYQLKCAFSFSYFLIFIFSSFLRSSDHPIIFQYFIFDMSDLIFHVFKNAVLMNSVHSVRKMFHRTEVVSSEPMIF
jgi:hypothetical protein